MTIPLRSLILKHNTNFLELFYQGVTEALGITYHTFAFNNLGSISRCLWRWLFSSNTSDNYLSVLSNMSPNSSLNTIFSILTTDNNCPWVCHEQPLTPFLR